MADRPLVYIELDAGQPTSGSLGVLGRAREIFAGAAAVIGGQGAARIGDAVGDFGADEIYTFEEDASAGDPGLRHTDAIAHLVEEHGFRTVLLDASDLASNIAGALSVRLDAGVNWALRDLSVSGDEVTGFRHVANETLQASAGRVIVGWASDRRLAVFAPDAFEPRRFTTTAVLMPFTPAIRSGRRAVRVVSEVGDEPLARTLGTADVIVAGGRGMRGPSVIRMLEELAHLLGGAVGVSMPIVDRGWYPYEHQVGSATPRVRPRIYIACGISGSLQHRIGMQHSEFIVTINTDRDAPIMKISDVGVVGDLHDLVPQLIELARAKKLGDRGGQSTANALPVEGLKD